MNDSGIFSLIETLFPILIFLFWLVITFFANTKKRNPVPNTNKSQENSHEQTQKRKEISLGEELKRSLETIFGEMGNETKKSLPKVEKSKENEKENKFVEKNIIEDQDYQILKEKASDNEQKEFENAYGPYNDNKIPINLSHKDLRKAVILSEIIAPPVSIRNER